MRAQASIANRGLGNQRHIDGDAVAFAHSELLERVGAAAHFVGKHLVGQDARIAGLTSQMNATLLRRPSVR